MARMMFLKLNLYLIFENKNCSQQLPRENEAVQRLERGSASSSEERHSVASSLTQRRPVETCYSKVQFKGEDNSSSEHP